MSDTLTKHDASTGGGIEDFPAEPIAPASKKSGDTDSREMFAVLVSVELAIMVVYEVYPQCCCGITAHSPSHQMRFWTEVIYS